MRLPADPTATEVAAYIATRIAEYVGYAIIFGAIAGFWIGTPA